MEWKSFRNLWLYSKESTCRRFLSKSPTCVDFDEKLLFHYNTQRQLMDKPDAREFTSVRLNLRPLKMSILRHVDEWISTLGVRLKQTAQVRLDSIIEKVDSCSQQMKPVSFFAQLEESLVLISEIEKISLEVEMSYNDVEERCR